MKKLIAVILALAAVFSVTANAGSFFPVIEAENEYKGFALDYGMVFEVAPDLTEDQEDGSCILYFAGVEEYAYMAYGEALQEDGYTVTGTESLEDRIQIDVEKVTEEENVAFTIVYLFNDKVLAHIIPEGLSAASMDVMSQFAEYTEVKMNQWFKLPGIGKMRFTDFELNKSMNITYYYTSTGFGYSLPDGPLDSKADTYILGEFDNTTSGTVYNYQLPVVRIHYINEDDEFIFDSKVKGAYTGSKIYNSRKTTDLFDIIGAPTYPSLQVSEIGYAYTEIPDRVRTSTDGAIVITVEYEGENFVMYIRK